MILHALWHFFISLAQIAFHILWVFCFCFFFVVVRFLSRLSQNKLNPSNCGGDKQKGGKDRAVDGIWSVHEPVAFSWTCSLVPPALLQANPLLVEQQMSEQSMDSVCVCNWIQWGIKYARADQERWKDGGGCWELVVLRKDTKACSDIVAGLFVGFSFGALCMCVWLSVYVCVAVRRGLTSLCTPACQPAHTDRIRPGHDPSHANSSRSAWPPFASPRLSLSSSIHASLLLTRQHTHTHTLSLQVFLCSLSLTFLIRSVHFHPFGLMLFLSLHPMGGNLVMEVQ